MHGDVAFGVDSDVVSTKGWPFFTTDQESDGASGMDQQFSLDHFEANARNGQFQQALALDRCQSSFTAESNRERAVAVQCDCHTGWLFKERQQKLTGKAGLD